MTTYVIDTAIRIMMGEIAGEIARLGYGLGFTWAVGLGFGHFGFSVIHSNQRLF